MRHLFDHPQTDRTSTAPKLDPLSLIFKRCLIDQDFRQHFLTDPYRTMLEAGYRLPVEDIDELETLARSIRQTAIELNLSIPERRPGPLVCGLPLSTEPSETTTRPD